MSWFGVFSHLKHTWNSQQCCLDQLMELQFLISITCNHKANPVIKVMLQQYCKISTLSTLASVAATLSLSVTFLYTSIKVAVTLLCPLPLFWLLPLLPLPLFSLSLDSLKNPHLHPALRFLPVKRQYFLATVAMCLLMFGSKISEYGRELRFMKILRQFFSQFDDI